MSFQNLSSDDKAHMRGMLASYGLFVDHLNLGNCVIPPKSEVVLSANTNDSGTHLKLRTNDLDQAKAWMGVPNYIFTAENPCALEMPVSDAASSGGVAPEEIYYAARKYIWGDSRLVEGYKSAIENYVGTMESTVHIYTTLDVKGVLRFTDEATVIVAHTISFYPGGQIIGSNLKISATVINRLS